MLQVLCAAWCKVKESKRFDGSEKEPDSDLFQYEVSLGLGFFFCEKPKK